MGETQSTKPSRGKKDEMRIVRQLMDKGGWTEEEATAAERTSLSAQTLSFVGRFKKPIALSGSAAFVVGGVGVSSAVVAKVASGIGVASAAAAGLASPFDIRDMSGRLVLVDVNMQDEWIKGKSPTAALNLIYNRAERSSLHVAASEGRTYPLSS